MSGNTVRQQAISKVSTFITSSPPLKYKEIGSGKQFGANVFGLGAMKSHLPKDVYKSLRKTIDGNQPLDPATADAVAAALKDWALGRGATHFAHIFYPLTGSTAEKHDSFYNPDGEGNAIAEFSGKRLIQGEPDASSFPNGGIRATSEARGYTAWDVTSPAYLMETENGVTLCIPTAFVSWTGEALDTKTPVLRATAALNTQATRVLKLFGHETVATVTSYMGCEQEYFLIDKNFYLARPDLLNAGRTLFGAKPPKGQEFEDHYFGVIPSRVMAFMFELERELLLLGIPVAARHNEVAPGQFEIAPVFEGANIAADHQQLVMVTLKSVAEKHDLVCLLHEKPFAGVNGSGKHLNYSIGNSTQGNLLDPGATPHDNAQFMVFCGAVVRAVHKFGGLLRAAIASASNDHRLGANEAPPAIISIFMGDQLADVWEQVKAGGAKSSKLGGKLQIGVDSLPHLPRDAGDRNRTSPFAFTGNRFEFRALGSSQAPGIALATLNTILADSLDFLATKIEAGVASGKTLNATIQTALQELYTEHGAVVFNGNGYSEEWHKEAERRGLLNLRTSVDALPQYETKEAIALFDKYKVLSPRELHARYEVFLEQYVKTINVEKNLVLQIAKTQIIPATIRFQTELATNVGALKAAGVAADTGLLLKITGLLGDLSSAVASLEKAAAHHGAAGLLEEAKYFRDAILPAQLKVREVADTLEGLVADDVWPLPTYQEMLFIK
ncbi:MAG: glutamine synthetase III [Polyangiaceae bacterium]